MNAPSCSTITRNAFAFCKQSILLLILIFCHDSDLFAQKEIDSTVFRLLEKYKLSVFSKQDAEDPDKYLGSYSLESEGLRMIYLQQYCKGIPVLDAMKVLAFRGDSLLSVANNFLHLEMDSCFSNIPNIKPEEAILTALASLSIKPHRAIEVLHAKENVFFYKDVDISYSAISCKLIWLPVSEKSIQLVWQVELLPVQSSDHLLISVDAHHNSVLDKINLTVYEHDEEILNQNTNGQKVFDKINDVDSHRNFESPTNLVHHATYKVIPYPNESPSTMLQGIPELNDPWLIGNAPEFNQHWHFDGYVYHDSTRGNNVWVQEDRDNNNATYGRSAVSSTPSPNCRFDVLPDFANDPTFPSNQQFAMTNLFYWNNLMHDITYQYGFDEASGNFQFSNFSGSGFGNDLVIADAQDGGRFNNANFTTPIDGISPRMQIYLYNTGLPFKDADADNGIIVHEYTHGISNRLTGGPLRATCLSNAEQAGEGWSDYFALMMTTNWELATILDQTNPRTLGTYVLNQGLTGRGIRSFPYSTDLNVDPWNYGMLSDVGTDVHKIGEIWCSALWDMTWNLIAMEGINKNIFNPDSLGGNSIALKLVMEGMRLQSCRPGLIDSRNAILKADSIFFQAKYSCTIWDAFAKRGMGKNAIQGSSNSTKDQIADYSADIGMHLSITQNVSEQNPSGLITYCHTVKASPCFDIVNNVIRDTLPLNVTYISGGSYDSISRVVSFLVNVLSGSSATYYLTVKVNNDAYFEPMSLIEDSVSSTSFLHQWVIDPVSNSNWRISNEIYQSAPCSFFCMNVSQVSDQNIVTQRSVWLPLASSPQLIFSHWMQSEKNWDGGVVEISTDEGITWTDAGNQIEEGYYNGAINLSGNPISGRPAFTGSTEGFITTRVNLSSFCGRELKFRFRFATDENYAARGWSIDDIRLVDTAMILMTSVIIDSNNRVLGIANGKAKILPALICDTIRIWNQPDSLILCEGATDSIACIASGTGLIYQWQISTDNGLHYVDIEGAVGSTLSFDNTDGEDDQNLFRCMVLDNCGGMVISNVSRLKIISLPIHEKRISRCGPGNVTISMESNTSETIDWYADENALQPISSSPDFVTPVLTATTTYWMLKRNLNWGCTSVQKTIAIVTIDTIPTLPAGVDSSRCGPGSISLRANVTNGCTALWYDQLQGGIVLDSATIFRTSNISNTQCYYVASKSSNGCISNGRIALRAIVNPVPATVSTVSVTSRCAGESAVISATASTGNKICWFADSSSIVPVQIANLTGINYFQTPILQETTRYWVANQSITTGCFSAIKTPVRVYVYPRPVILPTYSFSRCGSGAIKMTLQSSPANLLSFKWFNSPVSTTVLGTSNVYTTPSITSNTNYYVETKNIVTGCVSENRTLINAIINPIPNAPVAVDASRCGRGNLLLRAIADVGIDWYAVATGAVPISVNTDSFVCIDVTATKQYYALAHDYNSGCRSLVRKKVSATIIPILSAPRTISGVSNICPFVGKAQGLLYTASSVSGAQRYIWSFPSTAIIDSGGDGLKVKLHFIGASPTDTIFVMADNGCNGLRKFMKLNTLDCGTIKSTRESQITSVAKMMMYPNPSITNFTLKLNAVYIFPVSLIIMDMQGRTVKTYSISESGDFIFGNELMPGIYYAQVIEGRIVTNFKIIKL